MTYDYAIIGQGLAGSILAYELEKIGKSFLIFNDHNRISSSSVAGGMFNPITGKYLAKTWMMEEIFPEMESFFNEFDSRFNNKTLHKTQLIRPFANENQKQNFLNLIEKHGHQKHFNLQEKSEDLQRYIENPIGSLLTLDAGWIDVPLFLEVSTKYFRSTNLLNENSFEYEDLKSEKDTITYKDLNFKNIVFCEGFYGQQNPFFNWLPFNPVKGETLLVKFEENYPIKEIVNGGSWLIPLDNNRGRIGATYSWHELDSIPTEKGKTDLEIKISKFLKSIYSIEKQTAGVRPATTDRRPFLGRHPQFSNYYIFNGLGTKGVSLAPYFAKELIQFIENKKEISPEANIERFYALY